MTTLNDGAVPGMEPTSTSRPATVSVALYFGSGSGVANSSGI